MSAEFVPFLPSLRSRSGAVPSAAVSTFAPVTTIPAPQPSVPGKEPVIQVKRTGDRITHIQITCRCGEVIEVACEY